MIFDATIRNINLEEFKLPQTIYIAAALLRGAH